MKIFKLGILWLVPFVVQANGDIASLQDKRQLDTKVMVLGTPHLNIVKEPINVEVLNNVIQPLKAFAPSAVAIEALRSQDIQTMLNDEVSYSREIINRFVGAEAITLAKQQQAKLKLNASEALSKLNHLLAKAELTSSERLQAIELAIAAYERHTAALQFNYLHQNASVPYTSKELTALLSKIVSQNSEVAKIAMPVASALKINRLYPIDSHMDKDIYEDVTTPLLESFKKSKYGKQFAESEYATKPKQLIDTAIQSKDWLPVYSWYNSANYTQQVLDVEWSMFVSKDLAVKPALARVALWEVRNLNMVSNIMRIVSQHTGENILIIVGANHKVFFEQYLSKMIGVKVVQFNEFVAASSDN